MKKIEVEEEKIRLDIFLSSHFSISRSFVKTILASEGAVVNGKIKKKSGFELKKGDVVEFCVPETKEMDIEPCNLPLDIIYQDEDFAVVNKPVGMIVHQSSSYRENDTLVNVLLYHLDNLSGINGVIRPGIVHRLDKMTSGLLVVAKNDKAHNNLAKQIEEKSARRIYLGVIDGNIKEDSMEIEAPIGRSPRDRKKMAIVENGRYAKTSLEVLERFGKYTYCKFELSTGRTHQIRVHLKSINHPIVGDEVYSGSQLLAKNGQLLHAHKLMLKHPKTGEDMTFEAPLPKKFENVLVRLRNKRF